MYINNKIKIIENINNNLLFKLNLLKLKTNNFFLKKINFNKFKLLIIW